MKWKVLFFILCCILICFTPSLFNNFVNLDDALFLTDNKQVLELSANNLAAIFTSTVSKVYVPLTTLSFAIEHYFFGFNPFIYHLDNLLLHLAVTALVFYFALQVGLNLRAAGFAALLFGLHPIKVEAVAWITERKSVLYSLFYMLALINYWKFLVENKRRHYFSTIIYGFLSLLAKPMALSLPLILLILDWFKKRKLTKDVLIEKIPFFLFIIPISWITYSLHARSPGNNFLIWIWTLSFYLKKFFFPFVFLPLYRLPDPVSI